MNINIKERSKKDSFNKGDIVKITKPGPYINEIGIVCSEKSTYPHSVVFILPNLTCFTFNLTELEIFNGSISLSN